MANQNQNLMEVAKQSLANGAALKGIAREQSKLAAARSKMEKQFDKAEAAILAKATALLAGKAVKATGKATKGAGKHPGRPLGSKNKTKVETVAAGKSARVTLGDILETVVNTTPMSKDDITALVAKAGYKSKGDLKVLVGQTLARLGYKNPTRGMWCAAAKRGPKPGKGAAAIAEAAAPAATPAPVAEATTAAPAPVEQTAAQPGA